MPRSKWKSEEKKEWVIKVEDRDEAFLDLGFFEISDDSIHTKFSGMAHEAVEGVQLSHTAVRQESPDLVLLEARPPKKRRLIVEVVVPTLAQVHQRQKDFKQLKKMLNPKIKKKKNMELSLNTVWDRLKPISCKEFPIPLEREFADVKTGRDFLSSIYGGNMQMSCPNIAEKFLKEHGMNDFFYINPEYQPVCPGVPGAAGLWLSTSPGEDFEKIMRVFVRTASNVWHYLGMYRVLAANPPALTKEEWSMQKDSVKKTWATQITEQEWGHYVCAQILLRKEKGREGTENEIEEALVSKRFKLTTPDEVLRAYLRGEQRMGIWTLECVGYDADFQMDICDKFLHWVPKPRKKRGNAAGKKTNDRKPPKSRKPDARGVKRMRAISEETDTEDEENQHVIKLISDDEIEESRVLVYKSRGTKSRPIRL